MDIIFKIIQFFKFFPFQLLFAHLRRNHLLLLLWVVLFGFASQTIAVKFGIPYLFLSPEYLNEVNWISYFVLGLTIGGFFMAFHLYSYVMLGPIFPFIASIYRPFHKFCINNSVIPTAFYIVLVYNIYQTQLNDELLSPIRVIDFIIALTAGIITFIVITMLYFIKTNKTAEKIASNQNIAKSFFQKTRSYIKLTTTDKIQPSFYLSKLYKIKSTRDVNHYNQEILDKVFKQNHFNAKFFEVSLIGAFIFLGVFQNYSVVVIPAAASVMLVFTLFLMFVSFLYSWFRGWTFFVLLLIFVSLNLVLTNTSFFNIKNYAYGLDYSKKVDYSLSNIKSIQFNEADLAHDLKHHIGILNNWHQKAKIIQGTDKPKLVLVNVSGGGIRAAMWTFNVLQNIDRKMEGDFIKNTHFITGASGGMVGAAYYRDLVRAEKKQNIQATDSIYLEDISKDLLNRVAFSMVTHDLMMRHKKVAFNGRVYSKDRGFFFEQALNKNTRGYMNYTLSSYESQEILSQIPLMVFTPTIINDGRRMIVAPQPYAFLNGLKFQQKNIGPENVEWIKLFKNNDPLAVSYLSVLRMNATFPYVLPMVSMPTKPEIALMDAGIRDNYGTKTTIRYIHAFSKWIEENTSGIVIVEIRDIIQDYDIENQEDISLLDKLVQPTLNFYGNFHHAQEFNATELIEVSEKISVPIYEISFILRNAPKDNISLSWHLTQREKNKIKTTFQSEKNQKELQKLIHLLHSSH